MPARSAQQMRRDLRIMHVGRRNAGGEEASRGVDEDMTFQARKASGSARH